MRADSMISTPCSVISPTALQTLDVPMSNPTMMLCFFAIPVLPNFLSLLRQAPQPRYHLILETHIQGAKPLLFSPPQCHHPIQMLKLPFPVAPPHVNGHRMSDRVDHQTIRRIKVNLGQSVRILCHQIAQSQGILYSSPYGGIGRSEFFGPNAG